jgi:hypothetical protein
MGRRRQPRLDIAVVKFGGLDRVAEAGRSARACAAVSARTTATRSPTWRSTGGNIRSSASNCWSSTQMALL